MTAQRRLGQRKKDLFLQELAGGWSVSKAAKAAGIGRASAYRYRADDPEFAAAWDAALEQGVDFLEDMAAQRAEVSDTLLIFKLKGARPDKYARFEVSGPKGGPIQHEHRGVSLDDLLRFAAKSGQESDRPENTDA